MRSKEEIEKDIEITEKELQEAKDEGGKFTKNAGPFSLEQNQKISSNNLEDMKVVDDKIDRLKSKLKMLKNELDQ